MFSTLVALFLAFPAAAQPPKRDDDSGVPGYKPRTLQGFHLLVSDDVLAVSADKYKRPPLAVLDGELKTIVRVFKPAAVKELRGLTIWVDWDRREDGEVGRGQATAVYMAGGAGRGFHPAQAKTVTVLSMKSLTEAHQPDVDSGRCVLLHEFAHAVHDQVLPGGLGNLDVKQAYAAAVERRLYDRSQYASTSAAEFFADLSCAYLDRLDYFPHSRDDLKLHDPTTHKLMTEVWGTATVMSAKKASKPGDLVSKADPSLKLADIHFGDLLYGPKFNAKETAGRVVLVGYWGGNNTNLLDRLVALHSELSGYGLTVVAVYPYAGENDEVRRPAEERQVPFAVVKDGFILLPTKELERSLAPPHTIVFAADGLCTFRGSGFEVDKPTRSAVGRLLLGELADGEPVKLLKPMVDALKTGTAPLAALAKLGPALNTTDTAVKAAAKALADKLSSPAEAALEKAKGQTATDPVAAFDTAERLAQTGKGTAVGGKADALAKKLRQNQKVVVELRARKDLAEIERLSVQMRASAQGDLSAPAARARLRGPLAQLQAAVTELTNQFPNTRAAEQAKRIAREWELK